MNPEEKIETITTKIQKELELLDKLNSILDHMQDVIYGSHKDEVNNNLANFCCMLDAIDAANAKIEMALRKADMIHSGL